MLSFILSYWFFISSSLSLFAPNPNTLFLFILVAPTLDIVIYAEPANKVYLQGTIAAISNSITVAVLATILLHTYAKTKIKTGSLDKEY